MSSNPKDRELLILGCSSRKDSDPASLPALSRYDGPSYQVFRKFLRTNTWPSNLSVAVLSAEYGLIGGLAPIHDYEHRLTGRRMMELIPSVKKTLLKWLEEHSSVKLWMGAQYREAILRAAHQSVSTRVQYFEGGIGKKLSALSDYLEKKCNKRASGFDCDRVYEFFLPDWDDTVDLGFDFKRDKFSAERIADRVQAHGAAYMSPTRICDGILVSLAQRNGTKGLFRKAAATERSSLYPEPIRETYRLRDDQLVFGDCGAFSYSSEKTPPVTSRQAAEAYQLYGVDLAASVDHIPLPEIIVDGKRRKLSDSQQRRRVKITQENAEEFITLLRSRRYSFEPVGVIQGLSPESYGKQLEYYVALGYCRVALGGLVPRSDKSILEILNSVNRAKQRIPRVKRESLKVHLFGIYRPNIVESFHRLGATSFDSASYLRKAWMRSDQNYLGIDYKWYAAIRVPCLSDKRNLKRLKLEFRGVLDVVENAEVAALESLHQYGLRRLGVDKTLERVMEYYSMFEFGKFESERMAPLFRRTLESRIWESCDCKACVDIGVHVVVFRGYNRNVRRGMHNTALLYKEVGSLGG